MQPTDLQRQSQQPHLSAPRDKLTFPIYNSDLFKHFKEVYRTIILIAIRAFKDINHIASGKYLLPVILAQNGVLESKS